MAPTKTRLSSSRDAAMIDSTIHSLKRKYSDVVDDDNFRPQTKSSEFKSELEGTLDSTQLDTNIVTPRKGVDSSPTCSGTSKMTILPSIELQLLRDELIIAARNNEVLRDHNLQIVEDNVKLANTLGEERKVVAMLHEASTKWVRIEAQMKTERDIAIFDINELAQEVKRNKIRNAPLVNRVKGLEVTNDALNARIRGLENEVKELKEERERRRSVYPPL